MTTKPPLDFVPMSVCLAATVQNQSFDMPLSCLLDSGATTSWIKHSRLPKGTNGRTITNMTTQTMAGSFSSSREVTLQQVLLPEFHRTRKVTTMKARIFEADCQYDLILGRDMLSSLGIVINFANKTMLWDHSQVAIHQYPLTLAPSLLGQELLLDLLGPNLTFHDDAVFEAYEKTCMSADPKHLDNMYQEVDVDPNGYKAKTIRPAKYDATDL